MKFDAVFEQEARVVSVSPLDLHRTAESLKLPSYDYEAPFMSEIATAFSYQSPEINAFLTRMRKSILSRAPNLRRIRDTLEMVMQDIEIVYLPTYRRLELSLNEGKRDHRGRMRRPFQHNRSGLHSGEIQFGLGDIPERLSELNQNILVDSNQGYTAISANIVRDLLSGQFDRMEVVPGDEPTQEELTLLFSRLKESRRRSRFMSSVAPLDLEKLFSERYLRSEPSNRFLSFFLSQLNVVISATREKELLVQNFVDRCNSYLATVDESIGQFDTVFGSDDKELRWSRADLSVRVYRKGDKRRRIPLDALSSGEKQMISLMGKLYLYPKEKLVLIDEPELSLSMDWQRKILLDILDAPLSKQMIAITHSPFVFENELEPFARPLEITIHLRLRAAVPRAEHR